MTNHPEVNLPNKYWEHSGGQSMSHDVVELLWFTQQKLL